jgi:hypothetical protein
MPNRTDAQIAADSTAYVVAIAALAPCTAPLIAAGIAGAVTGWRRG